MVDCFAASKCEVKRLSELGDVVLRKIDVGEETEVVAEHLLHFFPCESLVLTEACLAVVGEKVFRHSLEVDELQATFFLVVVTTECHAAGVVVGSHYDERFVRVLQIEVVSDADCFLEVEYLLDDCRAVVGMGTPVDVAAFDHEEESLRVGVVETAKSGSGNLLGSQAIVGEVKCVTHLVAFRISTE